jgi:hypothetical protein
VLSNFSEKSWLSCTAVLFPDVRTRLSHAFFFLKIVFPRLLNRVHELICAFDHVVHGFQRSQKSHGAYTERHGQRC